MFFAKLAKNGKILFTNTNKCTIMQAHPREVDIISAALGLLILVKKRGMGVCIWKKQEEAREI